MKVNLARLGLSAVWAVAVSKLGQAAGATAEWWFLASGIIGWAFGNALYDAYVKR